MRAAITSLKILQAALCPAAIPVLFSLTSCTNLLKDPLTRDPLTREPLTREPLTREPLVPVWCEPIVVNNRPAQGANCTQGLLLRRFADLQICRCADLQICRFADLQHGNGLFEKRYVIPVQVHYCPRKILRHSCEGGNPPCYPSFPRKRKSTPSSVIPAKAGIHNSRACGNSSSHYPNARKNTPSFPRRRESTIPALTQVLQHFAPPSPNFSGTVVCAGGNVYSIFRTCRPWIPACTGMTQQTCMRMTYQLVSSRENTPDTAPIRI